jgi:hypothetical protein
MCVRVRALALILYALVRLMLLVWWWCWSWCGQVHELKMMEDKLSRTKVKYKMSRDVIAQLQGQLLSMSEEVSERVGGRVTE